MTLDLPDLAATEAFGRRLAATLRAGDAILLEGPLGAGKTALARALLRAACGDPALEVPSPSYTLVQSYDALPGFAIHHFDLWRLSDEAEVAELGWEEARDNGGVVLVEWPDRLGTLRPADALTVALAAPVSGGTGAATAAERRRATVEGWPDRLR